MPYKGIDYLKRKLISKRYRVQLRYKQYAMKHSDYEVGITISVLHTRKLKHRELKRFVPDHTARAGRGSYSNYSVYLWSLDCCRK